LRLLFFDGAFRGALNYGPDLGFHLLLSQVPLNAEMERQTHTYYC